MEGRETPQDLPDHLFPSSSSNHVPGQSDLDWVSNFLQLPTHHGESKDAITSVGGSSLLGGEAENGKGEASSNIASSSIIKDQKKKHGGGYRMRKSAKPRFAFRTKTSEDILDDGYRWRKYGQKAVKNSIYPRSYYRCAHHTCNVKKQVQRLSEDTSTVVTTYEGVHNHPCEQLMEALAPLLRQIQFLSKFEG